MTQNYDFIVIGGGSSGSILAATLASKGPTLLIERGVNHTAVPMSSLRQGWPQVVSQVWKPMQFEGSGHWTGTAAVLGGGSALNSAVCWRGDKSIFQSLGFENETIVDSAFSFLEEKLCTPVEDSNLNIIFREAWKQMGFIPVTSQYGRASWANLSSSKEMNSSSSDQVYIHGAKTLLPTLGKRRPSSYIFEHAFDGSARILDQGNLTVYLLTTARRILFRDNKQAYAVELTNDFMGNFTVYVRQNGKIFLNAGVYETPKLLMLSGIGPKNQLQAFNLPIVYDNPFVGGNLIDRKAMPASVPTFKRISGDDVALLDYIALSPNSWTTFSRPLSAAWGNAIFGCISCTNKTQTCFQKLTTALTLYGVTVSEMRDLIPMYVFHRYPATRGRVSLRSANYLDSMKIYDGWNPIYEELSLDAQSDLNVITDAVQMFLVDFLRNTTFLEQLGIDFQSYNGNFQPELVDVLSILGRSFEEIALQEPTCIINPDYVDLCMSWNDCIPTVPILPSDKSSLRAVVRRSLSSSHHGSGTCQVNAVVDRTSLAVKGVTGLYISDLSVVNQVVDIHPQLTVMAIAKLLGDRIEPLDRGYELFPLILAVFMMIFVVAGLLYMMIRNLTLCNPMRSKTTQSSIQEFDRDLDQPGTFQQSISPKNINLLSWVNLKCTYYDKTGAEITTLDESYGSLMAGNVTAVMGPSGGGKSTLLDILSGRKTLGKVTGQFNVLGEHISDYKKLSKKIQDCSAYIPQFEFFYPTQTPEEAVAFFATLKLGKDPDGENARREKIQSLLHEVDLGPSVSKRPIGGMLAGSLAVRGLSGGERKRLALCCALVMKPQLMFIDEITSGLDSEAAVSVMKILKKESKNHNVATMLVIHQPSPEVFGFFDNLILLGRGRCLFSDRINSLYSFYESCFESSMPSPELLAEDLIKKAKNLEEIPKSKLLPGPSEVIPTQTIAEKRIDTKPGIMLQFKTIFLRNLLNHYARSWPTVLGRLFIYSFLSLVCGCVFLNSTRTISQSDIITFDDATSLIRVFLFFMQISYLLPFTVIPIFYYDKRFFAAEKALGLYQPWMYGVTQLILETWVLTCAAILETCILVPMCGLWNQGGMNMTNNKWVVVLTMFPVFACSGIVGSSIILFICFLIPIQDLAFLIGASYVCLAQIMAGGYIFFPEIPTFIRWLQYISPCKFSLQGLLIAQLHGTSAEALLEIGKFNDPSTVTDNILVLCVYAFIFFIGSVVTLSRIQEMR